MEKGDSVDTLEKYFVSTSKENSEGGDRVSDEGLSCDAEEDEELRLFLSSESDSDGAVEEVDDYTRRCNLGGHQSVPLKMEKGDSVDTLEKYFVSTSKENSEGGDRVSDEGLSCDAEEDEELRLFLSSESDSDGAVEEVDDYTRRCNLGGHQSVPLKMEKGDSVDTLEKYFVSTSKENSEGGDRVSDEGLSCDAEEDEELRLFLSSESDSDGAVEEVDDYTRRCNLGGHQSNSNVIGANSNGKSLEIGEEEESQKTVKDNSLDAPRRTRRSARIQIAIGCGGSENSEGKEGSTNSGEENDCLMQEVADGKNTGQEKTKGMKTKAKKVSPRHSVADEDVERKLRRRRELGRKYYQEMSEDKKREYLRIRRETKKRRRASMTKEERDDYLRRRSEEQKRRRDGMSEEEKTEFNKRKQLYEKRRIAGMNQEEREEFRRKRSSKKLENYDSLTNSKKASLLEKQREYNRRYRSKIKQK